MPKVGDKVLVHKLQYNEIDEIIEIEAPGQIRLAKNRDTLFVIKGERGFPVRQATGALYIERPK